MKKPTTVSGWIGVAVALLAAAGKVTCSKCNSRGYIFGNDALHPFDTSPCADCSDLRALLEKGR